MFNSKVDYVVYKRNKAVFRKVIGIFKAITTQKCPDCNGVMKWEMIDMELDKNVYKCSNCGKQWV